MKDNQNISNNNFEEDSIDIVALIKNIWSERKLIIKVTISFFVIGCIVALLSPVKYTSQTTFVPQVSDNQMSNSSSLGALASSLSGINLNTNEVTSDSYLSPLLYTNIIDSEEFSLDLLTFFSLPIHENRISTVPKRAAIPAVTGITQTSPVNPSPFGL